MPGCFVAQPDCAPLYDDDSIPQEVEDLVKEAVDALWNYEWQPADFQAAQDARACNQTPVIPEPAQTVLATRFHGNYRRHRRDGAGQRKMESGLDGLIRCLEIVHGSVTGLKITVMDVVSCGDCVTALLIIAGTDLRPDGQTTVPGLFGAAAPTGRHFRAHTAVLFCLDNGRIKEDYLLYGSDVLFLNQSQVGHQP
jgi:hypothetical protein